MALDTRLEIRHCKEVLDKETTIGTGRTKSGKHKKFTFNTWMNEYTIWVSGERLEGGQAIEELLNDYNDL